MLQGLLTSIPKFWSKAELTQVLNAYFESSSSVSKNHTPQMSSLIRAVTKKAPAKVLLPLFSEMWTDIAARSDEVSSIVPPIEPFLMITGLFLLQNAEDRLRAYWSALKRTIRASPRPLVSDNLRLLFKTFLDAFEFLSSRSQLRETVSYNQVAIFCAS